MDLGLSEAQNILKSTTRKLFQKTMPIEKVRALRNDPSGYDPEIWLSVAELGWIGLTLPEELNGSGGNAVDLIILFEEMGRKLFPSPFLSQCLAAMALANYASENLREQLLPDILTGKKIIAFADLEEEARIGQPFLQTSISKNKDGYALTGEKRFVIDGAVANGFLVTAQSPENLRALVYVSTDKANVEVTPLKDAARRRMAKVCFKNVVVKKESLLAIGCGEEAINLLNNFGTLAICAEMTGAGEFILNAATEQSKSRHQFGQPIGKFQSIQHKCANMLIDLEVSRHITQYAAWLLPEGSQDAGVAVSQAKILISESINRIVREGQQIFGGLGYTEEHFMPLYFRYIKEGRALFGLPEEHRCLVANNILGPVRMQ
ncbi:MAG: acyl-CoA dehydrogenase family protein [Bacillota bacterium]